MSQAFVLDAAMEVDVSQSGPDLTGTWTTSGLLSGPGVPLAAVAGAGTFTGTVALGTDPAVTLSLRRPECPGYVAVFTGRARTAEGHVEVTGDIDVISDTCEVLLRFPADMVFQPTGGGRRRAP